MILLSLSNLEQINRTLNAILGRQNSITRRPFNAVKANQFRNRVRDYLELKHADSEYNVSSLSSDMGLSRSQLFRKCKTTLGKSPVSLIRDFRLEKAQHYMDSGIYNVSEAAYLAGFNSLSYFSKSFKRKFGRMPSKWIKGI